MTKKYNVLLVSSTRTMEVTTTCAKAAAEYAVEMDWLQGDMDDDMSEPQEVIVTDPDTQEETKFSVRGETIMEFTAEKEV